MEHITRWLYIISPILVDIKDSISLNPYELDTRVHQLDRLSQVAPASLRLLYIL